MDIIPNSYKNELIDTYNDPDFYEQNDNGNNNVKKRYYLIVGDAFGNIRIIDFYGFIKKNMYEIASKITNKSAFNLLKREDVNVETILNHNLKNKNEISLPKYTNMYYKMIRNEFRAHYEDITCITVLEEPLCFITASKDKYVKIYNFNCDCLGIINSLPKLTKIDLPKVDWKFKINEEKILEDEINEVVSIFEKVGVDKILVGSKVDKEVENIDINEKLKEEQEVKKKEKGYVKKKFKRIVKEEEEKANRKQKFNDEQMNISYEGFYVQEAQKSIENKMIEPVENIGINEMTNNIINIVVDATNKKNKRKTRKTIKRTIN